MSTTPEQDYIEQPSELDTIRSAHAELQRIKDYSDETIFPISRLESLYGYWSAEALNPIRSERNRSEAVLLARHQLFEIHYREGTLDLLQEAYE